MEADPKAFVREVMEKLDKEAKGPGVVQILEEAAKKIQGPLSRAALLEKVRELKLPANRRQALENGLGKLAANEKPAGSPRA